jgi:hypothetical protein
MLKSAPGRMVSWGKRWVFSRDLKRSISSSGMLILNGLGVVIVADISKRKTGKTSYESRLRVGGVVVKRS